MKLLLADYELKDLPLGNTTTKIGTKYSTVSPLISTILKDAIIVAGIIFLALLIFGGISFIMNAGSGDSKKSAQSKAAITNALIGFAIVIMAYTIIKVIEVILGINILNSGL